MKKAIAYVRYSSDQQGDGDTIERQTTEVQNYAKRNDLALVGVVVDEGQSASKGHHISKGNLGALLSKTEAGNYPNHAFLVEHMYRFSRLGIEKTFELIQKLQRVGVELHLTKSNRIIKSLNDLPTAILSAVDSYGAEEYTKKMGERVASAWAAKKRNAVDGAPITKRVPCWLRVEGRVYSGGKIINPGRFVEVPEVVEVVQEAFRHAALGLGVKLISRRVKGVSSLTWLVKVFTSRAVLGEFQPQKFVNGKRVPDGPPIPDYFPRIIEQSMWDAARAQIDGRNANGYNKGGNPRNDQARNLFTGIVWDITSAPYRTMQFQAVKQHKYLATDYQKVGDSRKQTRTNYDAFETAFLGFLKDLDWRSVIVQNESDELKEEKRKLEEVLRDLDKTSRRIDANEKELQDPEHPARGTILRLIAQDEAKLTTLNAQKDALGMKVSGARNKREALYTPETLIALIKEQTPEANDVRLRLRAEIRRRIIRTIACSHLQDCRLTSGFRMVLTD
jgi:DNA invertase Pin-like site-specific DNA recombinase